MTIAAVSRYDEDVRIVLSVALACKADGGTKPGEEDRVRATVSLIAVLAVMAGTVSVQAQAPAPTAAAPAEMAKKPAVTFGADLRLREEYFNNIHMAGKTGAIVGYDENDYFRVRTRAWVKWDMAKSASIYFRAANEFRYYMEPDDNETGIAATDAKIRAGNHKWAFPDELVVDNLYVDLKGGCGGLLDARIGRQDLMYGTGKIVLEGTPNDGSRTLYSDALKLSFKGVPKTVVDFFGIYNRPTNELAIGDEHEKRPVVSGIEKGGGVYAMNSAVAVMPFEVYYMFKSEEPYMYKTTTNITRDINTVGFRVMPKTGRFSGNLEVAHQFGQDAVKDINASMVDLLLSYQLTDSKMKPTISTGCYYLSGDDPNTKDKDEGWDPLWARYPQNSELYVFAYSHYNGVPGWWSNLTMPFIRATANVTDKISVKAQVSDLSAPEADGPGTGHRRGLLTQVYAEFKICKGLTGHLLADVLKEGDYYKTYDTEYFARWQLMYAF